MDRGALRRAIGGGMRRRTLLLGLRDWKRLGRGSVGNGADFGERLDAGRPSASCSSSGSVACCG